MRKHYGGIVALDDVSVDFHRGEIHAVVGENGAGKSTLMKIMSGAVRPDSGSIEIDGQAVQLDTPAAARRYGIGIVYQELSLFPDLSIYANLFSGAEPTHHGLVSRREMAVRAGPVLERLGFTIHPETRVRNLRMGDRQLVEIARVLLESPRVLILDEPNSALSAAETGRLFTILRDLRRDGITTMLVSHRLQEVFAISDRITVLRNGRHRFTADRATLTIAGVVEAMIGEAQASAYPERRPRTSAPTGPSLAVRDLSVGTQLRGVTLDARPGEIVGLAGLEGSGTSTLLQALFGLLKVDAGEVTLPDGRPQPRSPTDAARRRVCLVPADRRRQGLMIHKSIAQNAGHVRIGGLARGYRWFRDRDLAGMADRQIAALSIKAPSPWTAVTRLSGGNQQKVVVGKWLEAEPTVILLDDPTRGIDVGAKLEMYTLIRRLADKGDIVLFASSELPELVGLADRVLVLFRGAVVGEMAPPALNEDRLLHAINTGIVAAAAA
jgi:ribose transport system ATP-binding protein